MRRLADYQAGLLGHAFASAINRHEIIMASALHIQHDLCRIIDYDRADVQAMRRHRSKTETATLRNDDWSAIREIISRRTRRRGHDKTIRLIGNQKLAIHLPSPR